MKRNGKITAIVLVLLIILTAVSLTACKTKEEGKVVRISTTTSVNDSGLMQYLQPHFKKATGYDWEIASAGTGAAIESAKKGNADAILVHSKKAEINDFVSPGYAREVKGVAFSDKENTSRYEFMHNYFVLVGPNDDGVVAPVKNEGETVKDAFEAIAESKKPFISRGDASGTHNKEVTLWPEELNIPTPQKGKKGLDVPEELSWYTSAGQGMGACLTMANEKKGYVLTDKATFLKFKKDGNIPDLKILWEEDPSMINTYTMMAVNPDKFVDTNAEIDSEAADVFIKWMLSDEALKLIDEYGVEEYGERLFFADYQEKSGKTE